jgi:ABC-type sulfate/molybdate transport systems ATPase subunit
MHLLSVSGISRNDKVGFSIRDISFTQQPGQRLAIAGETGSGKTTLLKIISGLIQPDSGTVLYHNERVWGPLERLVPGHPSIAYLSQHFELRNNYWVHEILSYANELPLREADELYELCRIRHLLSRRTDQLSGGERQRIALARLLSGKPQLLLLDEPFSNLDAIHTEIIKSVIDDLEKHWGMSFILVSHDAKDMLSWAHEILVLRQGELIQRGNPEVIYKRPANEYVAALFGTYYVLSVTDDNIRICLRPGQLSLTSDAGAPMKGILQSYDFYGDYYHAKVLVNEKLFSIPCHRKEFETGAHVFVTYDERDLWWLAGNVV